MDVNTSGGFLDAIKDAVTQILGKSPILKQTDIGEASQPVYLSSGKLVTVTFRYYTSLSQLGLDSTATIDDIWSAMPNHSVARIAAENFSDTSQFPSEYGTLEIIQPGSSAREIIRFYAKGQNIGDYRMFLGASTDVNAPSGEWCQVVMTDRSAADGTIKLQSGVEIY